MIVANIMCWSKQWHVCTCGYLFIHESIYSLCTDVLGLWKPWESKVGETQTLSFVVLDLCTIKTCVCVCVHKVFVKFGAADSKMLRESDEQCNAALMSLSWMSQRGLGLVLGPTGKKKVLKSPAPFQTPLHWTLCHFITSCAASRPFLRRKSVQTQVHLCLPVPQLVTFCADSKYWTEGSCSITAGQHSALQQSAIYTPNVSPARGFKTFLKMQRIRGRKGMNGDFKIFPSKDKYLIPLPTHFLKYVCELFHLIEEHYFP